MTAPAAELQQALSSYVPELGDPARRRDLAASLGSQLDRREHLFGDDEQRRRRAAELLSAFLSGGSPEDGESGAEAGKDVVAADPRFAQWVRVLVMDWTAGHRERVRACRSLRDADAFLAAQLERLVALASETLVRTVAELLAEERAAGRLRGESPEDRFAAFRAWLGSSAGALALADRYPAAVIRAHGLISRRVDGLEELLQRFSADRSALAQVLGAVDDGSLIEDIELGSGDTHAGGRSVALLRLSAGERLVYKPRSLAVDAGLARFAGELNRALGTSLRVPAVLSREDHGWAEFIESAGTGDDMSGYPFRLGELAAVLVVLQSTDMHYENIVTDRAGRPVVVDAETVMTPAVRAPGSYAAGAGSVRAREFLDSSVAGLALLPLRVSVPGREGGLEIGASGARGAHDRSPFRSLVVRNPGRDDMHIALESAPSSVRNANPVPRGDLAAVRRYRDDVREGLRTTLAAIMAHRDEVLTFADESFGSARVRHVNTPTIFYAQLLRMCSHPKLLESAASHVAVLARVALRTRSQECPAQHEVAQLLHDDVPLFTAAADGRDLLDAAGNLLIPGFFDRSALQRVRDRLRTLSDREIRRQTEVVDLAFTAQLPDGGETTVPLPSPGIGDSPRDEAAAERTARQAVERILLRWVPATDRQHPGTFWGPVVTTSDSEQWVPGSLGYDVYGGSLGIALALAEAASLHDIPEAGRVAAQVTDPIKGQLLRGALADQQLSIGGMTGMGGTVWAIGQCDRLLGTQRQGESAALIASLTAHLGSHAPAEFTTGASGALAAACSLVDADATPTEHGGREGSRSLDELSALAAGTLPLLEEAARRAAAASEIPLGRSAAPGGASPAVPDGASAAVPGPGRPDSPGERPEGGEPVFTGFAHGLAGMLAPAFRAGVLLRGHSPLIATGLDAVARTMLEVLLDHIDEPRGLTRALGRSETSWAWCHGAPGVLLGLVSAARCGAPVPESVLRRLGEQTWRRGLGSNPTYCHGDLGSLEALAAWSRLAGDPRAEREALAETRRRARASATRPACGAADKYAGTDSLMVGRAGSLHAILRASAPQHCPDVLTLGGVP